VVDPITVVICTKGRAEAIHAATASALACTHPHLEVIVIDQNDDDATERALDDLRADARLRYVRSDSRGLSRARNEGLHLARTELVAFTDDDCEVPPDWPVIMQEVLEENPRAVLAFCKVLAGPHDRSAGFVPAFDCSGTQVYQDYQTGLRGMGAGLAVRRQAILDLGGFDEELGAGARYPSCEDRDMAVRALLLGWQACTTDRTFVIHHGFRSWKQGKALGARDFVGIGASCAKPLRAGHWAFVNVVLREVLVEALWSPFHHLLHLRPPHGKARAIHFMRGFVSGAMAPLDREHMVFTTRDRAPAPSTATT
jgi:glycosyltransferase involved in cell wall biosynthesis